MTDMRKGKTVHTRPHTALENNVVESTTRTLVEMRVGSHELSQTLGYCYGFKGTVDDVVPMAQCTTTHSQPPTICWHAVSYKMHARITLNVETRGSLRPVHTVH